MEKSRLLWFLIQKIDRGNPSAFYQIKDDKEKYPFFYLLNWNEKLSLTETKKVALQSLFRSNYKRSIEGALEISLEKSIEVENYKESNISQDDLINQFLENSPVISRLKKADIMDFQQEEDLSNQDFNYPISETFAKILVKQHKYDSAIEVFEQLSLKFPEKKTYFASLIIELKEKLNTI